jgi:hypothetical protein
MLLLRLLPIYLAPLLLLLRQTIPLPLTPLQLQKQSSVRGTRLVLVPTLPQRPLQLPPPIDAAPGPLLLSTLLLMPLPRLASSIPVREALLLLRQNPWLSSVRAARPLRQLALLPS